MIKSILITTVLAIISTAGLYVTFSEEFDDGHILVIGSHVYDPVGILNEITNKITRDCSEVVTQDLSSTVAKDVLLYLQNYTQKITKLNSLITSGSWVITEAEFQNAEPGSFLLYKRSDEYKAMSVWGGSNAPFKNGPAIREKFLSDAPKAPIVLIQCYDPITAPFRDF